MRGLSTEVSKSIGLALYLEVNLPFLLCFTLYLRANFQVQAPGGLYLEGRFNGEFFALPFGRTYFRNFTVCNSARSFVPMLMLMH